MAKHISRRKFIGQASCAGIGYTTLLSTLVNLKSMNAASIFNSEVGGSGDYKALICLMLDGGADSFNMLIPKGDSEWQQYKQTRSNLAIPKQDILTINPLDTSGIQLGLHPSMQQMRSMFEARELSFLTNVGALVEGVDKNEIWGGTANLPLGLFSHADQAKHWQTGVPQARVVQGWGGKIADLLSASNYNSNNNISMNISLSGSNTWQTGNETVEYAIDRFNGSTVINGYDQGDWQFSNMRTQAIDNMLDQYYTDMFKKSYVDVIKVAKKGSEQFTAAVDPINLSTPFSNTDLSAAFSMIAKTIAARDALGMTRQIFFVNYGGWDHHDEVLDSQEEMLIEVDNALAELMASLKELNVDDCVTLFSMSEFGRTLTSNGNGTDHAWGGNVFVMGGAVQGRKVIGQYPDLALNSNLEIGGGVLIPQISADEYFAELAMWFGVPPSELSTIFPNIGNFYSTSSGVAPLGFLL